MGTDADNDDAQRDSTESSRLTLDWMGWSAASAPASPTDIQSNEHAEQTTPVPLPADDLPTEEEVMTVVYAPTVTDDADNSTVSLVKATATAPVVDDLRTVAVVLPPPVMPPTTPYPYSQPSPYPPPPAAWQQPPPPVRRSRTPIALGVVAVVLVLAVAVVVWMLFSGTSAKNGSDRNAAGQPSTPDTYTACGTPPDLTVLSTALTDAGLAVTTSASSPCSTGDVLSNSATRIVVNSPTGLVAAGSFDLSANPVGIPPSNSQRRSVTVIFPPGSFYTLPDAISSSSALTTTVEPAGTNGVQELQASTEYSAVSLRPDAAHVPDGVDTEQTAGQSLQAQAVHDRAGILASANNRWHAQLSAKQPGLYTDGKTWQYTDILDEFAALDTRFSGTRLLWSNEWPVFTESSWWITITDQTFPSGASAVAWCVLTFIN